MIVQVGDGHFHFVIKLQAICRVLADDQIREDFKDGKIIPVANPSTILSSIDVIGGPLRYISSFGILFLYFLTTVDTCL